jgi:hypothetical protein
MTPRAEYAELVSRSKILGSAVLLLFLSMALLLVSAATLFLTTFITAFRTWRGVIDRMTTRVTIERTA